MKNTQKRTWDLYNLLNAAPNKWWTQKEICDNCEGYVYKYRNNDKCPEIRRDMIIINNNQEFEKIVVCKDYKFKIATKEEAFENYMLHVRRLKNQVKILDDLSFKMKRNGHFDIIGEKYHSPFLEEDNDR